MVAKVVEAEVEEYATGHPSSQGVVEEAAGADPEEAEVAT